MSHRHGTRRKRRGHHHHRTRPARALDEEEGNESNEANEANDSIVEYATDSDSEDERGEARYCCLRDQHGVRTYPGCCNDALQLVVACVLLVWLTDSLAHKHGVYTWWSSLNITL